MTVKIPTQQQMQQVCADLGLELSERELQDFIDLMQPNIDMLNWIESEPDFVPEVKYPRTPGYSPAGADNEFNAWARKTSVKGAADGKLKGRKVVLKDTINLAGVPLANGASTLSFHTPRFDATIATRILDAGGEIVGKAQCEFFSFTGNSHSNSNMHKVQNPHKPGHTPGGSSSGCGALVGGGVVEMGIGGDTGGSIRIPASWSGCVGMKPTHGLVPSTGVAVIESTVDHMGPMTMTVADNALLLEVIAGADGLDPRQYSPRTANYTEALGQSIKGLRIGVLKEGFGHANSDPEVDGKVRATSDVFRKLGAEVIDVSVPVHLQTIPVWFPITYQGAMDFMMEGNGAGSNWMGLYDTAMMDAHSMWRTRTHELSEIVKYVMLLGHFMKKYYRGHFYAKAQNIRRRMIAEYSKVFDSCDLVIFPTTPFTAPPIPPADCSLAAYIEASGNMAANTIAANLTHHPAMSMPIGKDKDGMPIGMTLLARHYDEPTIYRAAHALEQDRDWRLA